MIPLKLSLEGFLCYRDRQEINFADSNIWLLWGSNGTGKSSIPDAITFALYGKHRAGATNAKDLVNHDSNRLIIEFDFQGIDGVIYRVRCICSKEGHMTRSVAILSHGANGASAVTQVTPVSNADTEDGFASWRKRSIGLEFKAFTSSVLLLQGKSEQLLNMTPKERYDTLSEFMDFARYQRLHEIADSRRANYKKEAEVLEKQLQVIPIIASEEIAACKTGLEEKVKTWETSQARIQHIAALLERVKEREKLLRRRETVTKDLQWVEDFLQREEEIRTNFQAWQSLNQIVPILHRVVEQRQRIFNQEQSIADLGQQEASLLLTLQQSEQEKIKTESLVVEHQQHVETTQKQLDHYLRRLAELEPLVARFEQIEKLQAQLVQIEQQISDFPADIEQQLQEAEGYMQHLDECAQTFPWLQQIAQTRTSLTKILEDERQLQQQIVELHVSLQNARKNHNELNNHLNVTSEPERQLFKELTNARRDYEDAHRGLERFEKAAAGQQCELCGQTISPEHANRERVRLSSLISEKQNALDLANTAYQEISDQRSKIIAQVVELDRHIGELEREIKEKEARQSFLHTQSHQYVANLKAYFGNIQGNFREHVASTEPQMATHWIQTSYPAAEELREVEVEAGKKRSYQRYLEQLRSQHTNWRGLGIQLQSYQQQLRQVSAGIDIESAKQACLEKVNLEQQRQAAFQALEQHKQTYQQAELLVLQISRALEKVRAEFQQCQSNLNAGGAVLNEQREALQLFIKGLPQDWQERALLLKEGELNNLETRQEKLALYRELRAELDTAYHNNITYQKTLDELNEQIVAFSEVEQQDFSEVEQQLGSAKASAEVLDRQRHEARDKLVLLEERQRQHQELSAQKNEADRQFQLYKLLASLLGRDGLQRHLLIHAEKKIVDFANKALHGLSRGRLRLELRNARKTAARPAGQALDLVVHDAETGKRPIPVGQASGSQRFRIAVSLALAIGRQSNSARRGIESVIIDEGFGGLDASGRDDMIQELLALGQQLSRIILVSHSEEFAQAFRKRYSFELVDHATLVRLMTED